MKNVLSVRNHPHNVQHQQTTLPLINSVGLYNKLNHAHVNFENHKYHFVLICHLKIPVNFRGKGHCFDLE